MEFKDDELMDCPFCGCAPMIWKWRKNGLEIRCKGCISYKAKTIHHDLEWLQDKMINHWNTRFSTPTNHNVK